MKRNHLSEIIFIVFTLFAGTTLESCSIKTNSNNSNWDFGSFTKSEIKEKFNSLDFDYAEHLNHSFFTYEHLNYVFEYDDFGNVVRYDSFKEQTLDEKNVNQVHSGDDIFEVVSKIGLPSFEGLQSDLSLDFAKSENLICRIHFENNEQKLLVSTTEILDKENPSCWFDANKIDLPGIEDAKKIKAGMSLDHIVSILGKPQRDIGSGAIIFEFDLSNCQKTDIHLINNTELENVYVKENATKVYGTHYLYAVSVQIV